MHTIYIIGQCNMSSQAIYHLLTPVISDVKCTSVNDMSQLKPEEPVYIAITINIHYPNDINEKIDFLCRARKENWNMRIALIMMSYPIPPMFIDWLLQSPSFEYEYFDSHIEQDLASLEKKLSDFFLLPNHKSRQPIPRNKPLSRQERIVLLYLLQGVSLTTISKILNVSSKTVYCHRQNILNKLRLPGWRELLLYRKTILMIIRCTGQSRINHDYISLGDIFNSFLVTDVR